MRRLLPVSLALLAVLGAACQAPARGTAAGAGRGPAAGTPSAVAPASPARPSPVPLTAAETFALGQLARTARDLPAAAYPSLARGHAPWTTVGASDWVSGFFPGQLWLAYQLTGDPVWAARARTRQAALVREATDRSTPDLGFMFLPSFGNGWALTGDPAMRAVLLRAAATLAARYVPAVHAVRAWSTSPACPGVIVTIDMMMNVPLLFWAAAHGGPAADRGEAVAHALTALANQVRPDGSTYHYACYDTATGRRLSRGTVQGYRASSTWSRGQAWAINGFTTAYRYTRDPRFLAAARRTAGYFLDHLPPDGVPFWDFAAPVTPTTPRDTSAAAVAADGLLELARLDPDPAHRARYAAAGRRLVQVLTRPPWLAEGSGSRAILLHGSASVPAGVADTGLPYGDYYLLRAMLDLRLPPAGAR